MSTAPSDPGESVPNATALPASLDPLRTEAPVPTEPPEFGRPLHLLLRAGLDFGGDDVLTGQPTGTTAITMRAGSARTVSAGVILQPNFPLALEATFGYKTESTSNSNGSLKFTRWPLDIVFSSAPGGSRFGVGASIHFMPKLSCQVTDICDRSVKFDVPVGLIFQFAHTFHLGATHGVDLAARYTFISYSKKGAASTDEPTNGANLSLIVGLRL